eukprot:296198-Chlamydomonas_euryale.AAC.1
MGAPCILNCNMDLSLGAANGATGIITNYTCHGPTHSMVGMLKQLYTQLETGDIPVPPMPDSSRSHMEGHYFHSTFLVALVYTMAGHASQGLAIPGPVHVDVCKDFAPGLVYAMLLRVSKAIASALHKPPAGASFKSVPLQIQ